jgi:hypothetical protein
MSQYSSFDVPQHPPQILRSRASWRGVILARMETSLAIYEALIQATVPPPAARRVAECLERDMTSNLASKSDFLLVRQDHRAS